MMNDQGKLIEEAAKRLLKDVNPKHGRPVSSQLASDIRLVAGAVFEKAHTPTDDEREDMIAFLLRDHNFEESPWGRTYTDAEIAAALRRTEVPEPSADSHVFVAPVAGTYEVTPSGLRLLTAEPQGEPSDAQVEAAARAIADHQGVRYNSSLVDTWDGMARAALRAAGGAR